MKKKQLFLAVQAAILTFAVGNVSAVEDVTVTSDAPLTGGTDVIGGIDAPLTGGTDVIEGGDSVITAPLTEGTDVIEVGESVVTEPSPTEEVVPTTEGTASESVITEPLPVEEVTPVAEETIETTEESVVTSEMVATEETESSETTEEAVVTSETVATEETESPETTEESVVTSETVATEEIESAATTEEAVVTSETVATEETESPETTEEAVVTSETVTADDESLDEESVTEEVVDTTEETGTEIAVTTEEPVVTEADFSEETSVEQSNAIVVGTHTCGRDKEDRNAVLLLSPEGELIHSFGVPEFDSRGIYLTTPDFNADGLNDIAVNGIGYGKDVLIFDTSKKHIGSVLTNGDDNGVHVAFGDINGDSDFEIVVTNQEKDNQINFFDSEGTAIHPVLISDKKVKLDVAVGDVNGDGIDEIVLVVAEEIKKKHHDVFLFDHNVFIFNEEGYLLNSFEAELDKKDDRLSGLVVALGDVNGDEDKEIILGNASKGFGHEIAIYEDDGTLINTFKTSSKKVEEDEDEASTEEIESAEITEEVVVTDETEATEETETTETTEESVVTNETAATEETEIAETTEESVVTNETAATEETETTETTEESVVANETTATEVTETTGTTEESVVTNETTATNEGDTRSHGCKFKGHGVVLAAGDINDDGDAEIIVARSGGKEIRIYESEGGLIEKINLYKRPENRDQVITSLAFGEEMGIETPLVEELPPEGEPLENITVVGTSDEPVVIENREIQGTVRLSFATIVNINIEMGAHLILGPGVHFKHHSAIPFGLRLTNIFKTISNTVVNVEGEEVTQEVAAVDLSESVVEDAPPILEDIQVVLNENSEQENTVVTQNSETGHLEIDTGETHYEVVPTEVIQAEEDAVPGVHFDEEDGSIRFITHQRQEIIAYSTVQSMPHFVTGLSNIGLFRLSVDMRGMMSAIDVTNNIRYCGRSEFLSDPSDESAPEGVYAVNSHFVNFVFKKNGMKRRQIIYPAPVDLDALISEDTNADNVVVQPTGIVSFTLGGISYRGILSYSVIAGRTPESGGAEFVAGEDGGFTIIYPNGDRQTLLMVPADTIETADEPVVADETVATGETTIEESAAPVTQEGTEIASEPAITDGTVVPEEASAPIEESSIEGTEAASEPAVTDGTVVTEETPAPVEESSTEGTEAASEPAVTDGMVVTEESSAPIEESSVEGTESVSEPAITDGTVVTEESSAPIESVVGGTEVTSEPVVTEGMVVPDATSAPVEETVLPEGVPVNESTGTNETVVTEEIPSAEPVIPVTEEVADVTSESVTQ